jgi:hypothetical protein
MRHLKATTLMFSAWQIRLIAMKVDAEVATGMVLFQEPCVCRTNIFQLMFSRKKAKHPRITTFRLPLQGLLTGTLLSVLLFCTISTDPASPAATIRGLVGGWKFINLSWGLVAVSHTSEAAYQAHLCRKHETSPAITVSSVSASSVFGRRPWSGDYDTHSCPNRRPCGSRRSSSSDFPVSSSGRE